MAESTLSDQKRWGHAVTRLTGVIPMLAIESPTLMLVLVLVVVIALPLAGVIFAIGSKGAYRDIGGGHLSMDRNDPERSSGDSAAATREEIRQMVEASNFRREQRGEEAVEVDAEVERLMSAVDSDDPELREEIRQVVLANNERRERRGEEPLDVDEEVSRRLRAIDS